MALDEDKAITTVTSRIKEARIETTGAFHSIRATGGFPPTAITTGFLMITSGFLLIGAGKANRRVSGHRKTIVPRGNDEESFSTRQKSGSIND